MAEEASPPKGEASGNQAEDITRPAPVEDSHPTDVNKKRKATNPLNNPRNTPEATEPCTERISEAERIGSPSTQPTPVDDHPPTVRDQETKTEPSEDECESVSKLANKNDWESTSRYHEKHRSGQPGGKFVSLEYTGSEKQAPALVRSGHSASEGILESAYIGLEMMNTIYLVIFDNPYRDRGSITQDEDRTITHQSKGSHPDNLQTFLSRAEICLRLGPGPGNTCTVEPYSEFQCVREIDWDLVLKKMPKGTPVFKLSEVKSFRSNTATRMVYEVEIGGETMIYKIPKYTHSLLLEFYLLWQAAKFDLRTPRVEGLIGIDTQWGGFLMSSIPTSFRLSDCHGMESSLVDRQRWYDQISNAVHTLHRNEEFWGDVKPESVLIDKNGDACLTDFEGGCTEGWFDDELVNTVAGDLQGLERIRAFLVLEE
ncbi:hypothetical protein BDW62DRAFT_201036 [Aspergillus aurantiobrunneus]